MSRTHKIVDLDFTIQPIALPSVPGAERRIVVEAEVVGEAMEAVEEEETIEQAVQIVEGGVEDEDEDPSIAIKGPASGNKRRKVVLEESEQDESHSGRGKDQEAQPPGQTEEGKGAKFSQPRHKRETAGKWPASPKIPEDVGNEGKEVVSQSSEVQEEQEVESELRDDQEEVVVVDSRPLGRSSMGSKGFTNPRTKAKPKPHRRAQRQDNEDGDEATNFTFPVIVHRLGKSQVFTLPPGSQRGGVNPIDVISQVSMELVDKYFHKMKSSTERKAVESYKEELSLRFLELVWRSFPLAIFCMAVDLKSKYFSMIDGCVGAQYRSHGARPAGAETKNGSNDRVAQHQARSCKGCRENGRCEKGSRISN